ncbi:MAG: Crp/Fnr family transcriptional regulator [Beijerinckiaceae bacterium]
MTLEDDIEAVARHPTLAALEPEALRFLISSAETQTLRTGEVLFRRNDRSDSGFLILSGAISVDPADGGHAARILHRGTLLGDMALITKTKRPVTATALEPSSVLKITRVLFRRILNEHPRSAQRLRRSIAERLQSFAQELDDVRQQAFEAEE